MKSYKLVISAIACLTFVIGSNSVHASEKTHTVVAGETLSEIAHHEGVPLSGLIDANSEITNPNRIFPNDIIVIPSESHLSSTDDDSSSYEHLVGNDKEVAQSPHSEATAVDIDLLSRIIEAEAKGEPFAGKVAVGQVVLNRIASNQFPNDLQGVIYQQGQFVPAATGTINRPSSAESVNAASQALSIGGNPNGALFFYNAHTAVNRWLDTRPTVEVIGNHTFKR